METSAANSANINDAFNLLIKNVRFSYKYRDCNKYEK